MTRLNRKMWSAPLVALIGFSSVTVFAAPPPANCWVCGVVEDCNCNGVDDRCDVSCSNGGLFCLNGQPANAMCNSGWFPSCGISGDCNDNNVPDECDINASTSEDCNVNGIPDECEVCNNEGWSWITPCVDGLTCQPIVVGEESFSFGSESLFLGSLPCWCEGDWADAGYWQYLGNDCGPDCPADSSWPADSDDHAVIEASNTYSFCVDGPKDGDVCSSTSECLPLGTCQEETELRINLSTETIGYLLIRTANEVVGDETLKIRLLGDGAGSAEVLETTVLELDATNGTLTLSVRQGGELNVRAGS